MSTELSVAANQFYEDVKEVVGKHGGLAASAEYITKYNRLLELAKEEEPKNKVLSSMSSVETGRITYDDLLMLSGQVKGSIYLDPPTSV
ncbi:MAG: hypothetical protein KJ686_04770 [Actinobacteria bacterium]|nr:hypothetical protein [Actinomycetota bacterium]